MQLMKQSSYLELTNNKEEFDLVASFINKPNIGSLKSIEPVIGLIGYWIATLGAFSDVSSQEIKLIAEFINLNYSSLTIDEIKLAINLANTNKLDCRTTPYKNILTCKYVGDVLEAYKAYKAITLKEYHIRLNKYITETKKPTKAEKKKIFIDCMTVIYNDYKTEQADFDKYHLCYDFLKKRKCLKSNKEILKKANEFAEKQLIVYQEKINKNKFLHEIIQKKFDAEIIKTNFIKAFYVIQFFETTNFETFISSINETEFE